MKIAVFSDVHGNAAAVDRLSGILPAYDRIFFLGDGCERLAERLSDYSVPVLAVAGNCDVFSRRPSYIVEEINGVRIFLSHGHLYGVKSGYDGLLNAARSNRCSVALFGHTHAACSLNRCGVLLFNPGSAALPRSGKATFGVLQISDNKILPKFEVI